MWNLIKRNPLTALVLVAVGALATKVYDAKSAAAQIAKL